MNGLDGHKARRPSPPPVHTTDYLEGDVHFRTTRPGQNLDRAHTQFRLVDEMLAVYDRMLASVTKPFHGKPRRR